MKFIVGSFLSVSLMAGSAGVAGDLDRDDWLAAQDILQPPSSSPVYGAATGGRGAAIDPARFPGTRDEEPVDPDGPGGVAGPNCGGSAACGVTAEAGDASDLSGQVDPGGRGGAVAPLCGGRADCGATLTGLEAEARRIQSLSAERAGTGASGTE